LAVEIADDQGVLVWWKLREDKEAILVGRRSWTVRDIEGIGRILMLCIPVNRG